MCTYCRHLRVLIEDFQLTLSNFHDVTRYEIHFIYFSHKSYEEAIAINFEIAQCVINIFDLMYYNKVCMTKHTQLSILLYKTQTQYTKSLVVIEFYTQFSLTKLNKTNPQQSVNLQS